MRLARFACSMTIRLCVSDGQQEQFFDLTVFTGQSYLIVDWDYVQQEDRDYCVLQFARPRGVGRVPAAHLLWCGRKRRSGLQ